MQAIRGYYDGVNIKPLERISAKPNQRVIITVMDEFIEPHESTAVEEVFGLLSEHANPALINKERAAWENAAVQKHGHT